MTQQCAPSLQDNDDGTSPSSSNKSTTLSALWHGLGLFGESYLLFSVGTLRPIWETLYPSCFDEYDNSQCKHAYLSYKSITYSVVLGVMIGMVVLGVLANDIGRRRGSIITATFMALGSIMLTLSSIFLSSMPSILFPVMSISLFIFGFGVGGEYPLSASSASERSMIAMKERQKSESDRMKRLLQMSSVGGTNNESLNGNNNNQVRDDPCPTPRRDNRDIRMPSWQTLGSSSKTPKVNNIHTNSLSIKTEQLTPVTESYYSGGQGDIPLSPTNITKETNNSLSSYNIGLRTRGREVLLVFSMQGLGIFANSLILTFLLLITKNKNGLYQQDGDDANDYYNDASYYYDQTTLLNIWRVTYAIGAAILTYVLVTRISHLTESEVWIRDKEQREKERLERCQRESGVGFRPPQQQEMVPPYEKQTRKDTKNGDWKNDKDQQEAVISLTMSSITMRSEFDHLGSTNLDGCRMIPAVMMTDTNEENENTHDKLKLSSETRLLLRHYGVRLFGTSMTWLLWDIAFYGNKLFQSSFLIALTGEEASLIHITSASALNAFVSLLGYYAAAAIVDDPDIGRLALQQTGFVITGTLFILCGCLNDRISSSWLIVMYFGSSFFGQCGPNCTTFLIPAEVFPTNMRAMCHGVSASSGKLGALIASILFNFVGEKDLFLFSGYASFIAFFITFLTIPETTTLDLFEIDKQWHKILSDERYEGPATDPKHLSFYERNQYRPFFRSSRK